MYRSGWFVHMWKDRGNSLRFLSLEISVVWQRTAGYVHFKFCFLITIELVYIWIQNRIVNISAFS